MWNPPGRYLTPLLPLAAVPLAGSLVAVRDWLYRVTYAALVVPGLFLMAIMLDDARLLWPFGSRFGWIARSPDSPLHLNVESWLPSFSPLDGQTFGRDTAWTTAVTIAIVLFCLSLRPPGDRPRGLGRGLGFQLAVRRGYLAVTLVVAAVGAAWFFMAQPYIQH